MPVKSILVILIGTGLILLVPFVAMQFTEEVNWSLGDFIAAAGLLSGTGLLYLLATRFTNRTDYRVTIGAALASVFLLVWAELAVGIF